MNSTTIRSISIGLALLLLAPSALAQTEEDVLGFSTLTHGSSARSLGMAGAFGALGADPSAAVINPAGMALYSTSEFSITPSFDVQRADAKHYGFNGTGTDHRFYFNNLLVQFAARGDAGSKWTNFSFGISYDRLASNNWERQVEAEGVNSSIAQAFAAEANGTPYGMVDSILPYSAGLAWLAYAIDPLDTTGFTYTSAIPSGSLVDQTHTISSAGNVRSWNLFFAASRMDELFIGGSIGIHGVRNERITTHVETTVDEDLPLEKLTYKENLLTTGMGFDIKLGAVMRAGDAARFGLAFHSPIWLSLTDGYTTEMRTAFRDNGDRFNFESPEGNFNYRARTPLRVVASGAVIVGKVGTISADYEFADFRHMRLNHATGDIGAYDFSEENGIIKERFTVQHHVRVGTEWRIASKVYLRGGVGYWPDPYVDEDPRGGEALMRYTGGIGYRTQRWSLDFAGLYGSRTAGYYQYNPNFVEPTTETLTETKVFVTFSYRP